MQGLGIIPANIHGDIAASNIALCGYPRLIGLILRIGYSRERERDGAFKLRD